MSKHYAIAYKDKDGRDFDKNEPWVEDMHDCNLRTTQERAEEFRREGFQDVVLFEHPNEDDENAPEVINWDYVRAHRVTPLRIAASHTFSLEATTQKRGVKSCKD